MPASRPSATSRQCGAANRDAIRSPRRGAQARFPPSRRLEQVKCRKVNLLALIACVAGSRMGFPQRFFYIAPRTFQARETHDFAQPKVLQMAIWSNPWTARTALDKVL